jgi:hypothetical protein
LKKNRSENGAKMLILRWDFRNKKEAEVGTDPQCVT